ncbi:hypothetical protein LCGC14_2584350 [marine sediment metagenome]|uniref:Uncharacterized protein n=1 Tax=marine sediment metagenome TaxID=412755 RepID=A0A0F9ADV5_9ZZZZ
MVSPVLSQNVAELSKSDLLERANQFIFSTGLNDGASNLCKANMKYGLSQFHLIQEKYDDDMIISMTRSWEDTHKKYWYEGSPKSVVLISYSLSYIKPANYIQVEGVLENEKETTI